MDSQPPLPLSQAQQGIWLGHSLSSAQGLYNAAECIEFTGAVDIAVLSQSIQAVLAQADALHMTFPSQNKQQCASVASKVNVNTQFKGKSLADALAWVREDVLTPMDLQQGPLSQHTLLVLSAQQAVWYLKVHHIVCDGYGFAMLAQKVAQAYQFFTANADGHLPEFFGDYGKVLQADEHYQKSAKREQDKHFWLQALAQFLQATHRQIC